MMRRNLSDMYIMRPEEWEMKVSIRKIIHENKRAIVFSMSILAALILALYVYKKTEVEIWGTDIPSIGLAAKADVKFTEKITQADVISQVLTSKGDNVSGLILFFERDEDCNAVVYVSLLDNQSNEELFTWTLQGSQMINDSYTSLLLQEPIIDSLDKEYRVEIRAPESTEESGVSLKYRTFKPDSKYDYNLNSNKEKGSLISGLYTRRNFIANIYVLLGGACVVIFCILLLGIYFFKWKIPSIFVVLAMVLGSLYIVVIPPYASPDETSHLATTYYNANRILGREATDSEGNVLVRAEELEYVNWSCCPAIGDYLDLYQNLQDKKVSDEQASYYKGPLVMPITAHLPQSIGVAMAWILNLNCSWTFILGRFMGLLFYVFFCYWGIKKAPFGKMILFSVSLTPMSLQLATSFSYDLVSNAMCIFLIGYSLYLAYEKTRIRWYDMVIYIVVSTYMIPIKVIFALICGMIFLIPSSKFSEKWHKYIFFGVTTVVGSATILLSRMATLSDVVGGTQVAFPGVEMYSLNKIVGNIPNSFTMLLNTIRRHATFYLQTAVGGQLGSLDLQVSWFVVCSFLVIMLLSSITVKTQTLQLKKAERTWISILCVCMFMAVILSMWLSWTPASVQDIMGVQGRYFIPIIPMGLLLLRNSNLTLNKAIDGELCNCIFLFNVIALLQVLSQIIERAVVVYPL